MSDIQKLKQSVIDHRDYCEQRFESGTKKMDLMIEAQNTNNLNIVKLSEEVSALTKDTRGMLEMYRDVQGAARVGKMVKKVALWISAVPFVGAGVHYAYSWVIKTFESGI